MSFGGHDPYFPLQTNESVLFSGHVTGHQLHGGARVEYSRGVDVPPPVPRPRSAQHPTAHPPDPITTATTTRGRRPPPSLAPPSMPSIPPTLFAPTIQQPSAHLPLPLAAHLAALMPPQQQQQQPYVSSQRRRAPLSPDDSSSSEDTQSVPVNPELLQLLARHAPLELGLLVPQTRPGRIWPALVTTAEMVPVVPPVAPSSARAAVSAMRKPSGDGGRASSAPRLHRQAPVVPPAGPQYGGDGYSEHYQHQRGGPVRAAKASAVQQQRLASDMGRTAGPSEGHRQGTVSSRRRSTSPRTVSRPTSASTRKTSNPVAERRRDVDGHRAASGAFEGQTRAQAAAERSARQRGQDTQLQALAAAVAEEAAAPEPTTIQDAASPTRKAPRRKPQKAAAPTSTADGLGELVAPPSPPKKVVDRHPWRQGMRAADAPPAYVSSLPLSLRPMGEDGGGTSGGGVLLDDGPAGTVPPQSSPGRTRLLDLDPLRKAALQEFMASRAAQSQRQEREEREQAELRQRRALLTRRELAAYDREVAHEFAEERTGGSPGRPRPAWVDPVAPHNSQLHHHASATAAGAPALPSRSPRTNKPRSSRDEAAAAAAQQQQQQHWARAAAAAVRARIRRGDTDSDTGLSWEEEESPWVPTRRPQPLDVDGGALLTAGRTLSPARSRRAGGDARPARGTVAATVSSPRRNAVQEHTLDVQSRSAIRRAFAREVQRLHRQQGVPPSVAPKRSRSVSAGRRAEDGRRPLSGTYPRSLSAGRLRRHVLGRATAAELAALKRERLELLRQLAAAQDRNASVSRMAYEAEAHRAKQAEMSKLQGVARALAARLADLEQQGQPPLPPPPPPPRLEVPDASSSQPASAPSSPPRIMSPRRSLAASNFSAAVATATVAAAAGGHLSSPRLSLAASNFSAAIAAAAAVAASGVSDGGGGGYQGSPRQAAQKKQRVSEPGDDMWASDQGERIMLQVRVPSSVMSVGRPDVPPAIQLPAAPSSPAAGPSSSRSLADGAMHRPPPATAAAAAVPPLPHRLQRAAVRQQQDDDVGVGGDDDGEDEEAEARSDDLAMASRSDSAPGVDPLPAFLTFNRRAPSVAHGSGRASPTASLSVTRQQQQQEPPQPHHRYAVDATASAPGADRAESVVSDASGASRPLAQGDATMGSRRSVGSDGQAVAAAGLAVVEGRLCGEGGAEEGRGSDVGSAASSGRATRRSHVSSKAAKASHGSRRSSVNSSVVDPAEQLEGPAAAAVVVQPGSSNSGGVTWLGGADKHSVNVAAILGSEVSADAFSVANLLIEQRKRALMATSQPPVLQVALPGGAGQQAGQAAIQVAGQAAAPPLLPEVSSTASLIQLPSSVSVPASAARESKPLSAPAARPAVKDAAVGDGLLLVSAAASVAQALQSVPVVAHVTAPVMFPHNPTSPSHKAAVMPTQDVFEAEVRRLAGVPEPSRLQPPDTQNAKHNFSQQPDVTDQQAGQQIRELAGPPVAPDPGRLATAELEQHLLELEQLSRRDEPSSAERELARIERARATAGIQREAARLSRGVDQYLLAEHQAAIMHQAQQEQEERLLQLARTVHQELRPDAAASPLRDVGALFAQQLTRNRVKDAATQASTALRALQAPRDPPATEQEVLALRAAVAAQAHRASARTRYDVDPTDAFESPDVQRSRLNPASSRRQRTSPILSALKAASGSVAWPSAYASAGVGLSTSWERSSYEESLLPRGSASLCDAREREVRQLTAVAAAAEAAAAAAARRRAAAARAVHESPSGGALGVTDDYSMYSGRSSGAGSRSYGDDLDLVDEELLEASIWQRRRRSPTRTSPAAAAAQHTTTTSIAAPSSHNAAAAAAGSVGNGGRSRNVRAGQSRRSGGAGARPASSVLDVAMTPARMSRVLQQGGALSPGADLLFRFARDAQARLQDELALLQERLRHVDASAAAKRAALREAAGRGGDPLTAAKLQHLMLAERKLEMQHQADVSDIKRQIANVKADFARQRLYLDQLENLPYVLAGAGGTPADDPASGSVRQASEDDVASQYSQDFETPARRDQGASNSARREEAQRALIVSEIDRALAQRLVASLPTQQLQHAQQSSATAAASAAAAAAVVERPPTDQRGSNGQPSRGAWHQRDQATSTTASISDVSRPVAAAPGQQQQAVAREAPGPMERRRCGGDEAVRRDEWELAQEASSTRNLPARRLATPTSALSSEGSGLTAASLELEAQQRALALALEEKQRELRRRQRQGRASAKEADVVALQRELSALDRHLDQPEPRESDATSQPPVQAGRAHDGHRRHHAASAAAAASVTAAAPPAARGVSRPSTAAGSVAATSDGGYSDHPGAGLSGSETQGSSTTSRRKQRRHTAGPLSEEARAALEVERAAAQRVSELRELVERRKKEARLAQLAREEALLQAELADLDVDIAEAQRPVVAPAVAPLPPPPLASTHAAAAAAGAAAAVAPPDSRPSFVEPTPVVLVTSKPVVQISQATAPVCASEAALPHRPPPTNQPSTITQPTHPPQPASTPPLPFVSPPLMSYKSKDDGPAMHVGYQASRAAADTTPPRSPSPQPSERGATPPSPAASQPSRSLSPASPERHNVEFSLEGSWVHDVRRSEQVSVDLSREGSVHGDDDGLPEDEGYIDEEHSESPFREAEHYEHSGKRSASPQEVEHSEHHRRHSESPPQEVEVERRPLYRSLSPSRSPSPAASVHHSSVASSLAASPRGDGRKDDADGPYGAEPGRVGHDITDSPPPEDSSSTAIPYEPSRRSSHGPLAPESTAHISVPTFSDDDLISIASEDDDDHASSHEIRSVSSDGGSSGGHAQASYQPSSGRPQATASSQLPRASRSADSSAGSVVSEHLDIPPTSMPVPPVSTHVPPAAGLGSSVTRQASVASVAASMEYDMQESSDILEDAGLNKDSRGRAPGGGDGGSRADDSQEGVQGGRDGAEDADDDASDAGTANNVEAVVAVAVPPAARSRASEASSPAASVVSSVEGSGLSPRASSDVEQQLVDRDSPVQEAAALQRRPAADDDSGSDGEQQQHASSASEATPSAAVQELSTTYSTNFSAATVGGAGDSVRQLPPPAASGLSVASAARSAATASRASSSPPSSEPSVVGADVEVKSEEGLGGDGGDVEFSEDLNDLLVAHTSGALSSRSLNEEGSPAVAAGTSSRSSLDEQASHASPPAAGAVAAVPTAVAGDASDGEPSPRYSPRSARSHQGDDADSLDGSVYSGVSLPGMVPHTAALPVTAPVHFASPEADEEGVSPARSEADVEGADAAASRGASGSAHSMLDEADVVDDDLSADERLAATASAGAAARQPQPPDDGDESASIVEALDEDFDVDDMLDEVDTGMVTARPKPAVAAPASVARPKGIPDAAPRARSEGGYSDEEVEEDDFGDRRVTAAAGDDGHDAAAAATDGDVGSLDGGNDAGDRSRASSAGMGVPPVDASVHSDDGGIEVEDMSDDDLPDNSTPRDMGATPSAVTAAATGGGNDQQLQGMAKGDMAAVPIGGSSTTRVQQALSAAALAGTHLSAALLADIKREASMGGSSAAGETTYDHLEGAEASSGGQTGTLGTEGTEEYEDEDEEMMAMQAAFNVKKASIASVSDFDGDLSDVLTSSEDLASYQVALVAEESSDHAIRSTAGPAGAHATAAALQPTASQVSIEAPPPRGGGATTADSSAADVGGGMPAAVQPARSLSNEPSAMTVDEEVDFEQDAFANGDDGDEVSSLAVTPRAPHFSSAQTPLAPLGGAGGTAAGTVASAASATAKTMSTPVSLGMPAAAASLADSLEQAMADLAPLPAKPAAVASSAPPKSTAPLLNAEASSASSTASNIAAPKHAVSSSSGGDASEYSMSFDEDAAAAGQSRLSEVGQTGQAELLSEPSSPRTFPARRAPLVAIVEETHSAIASPAASVNSPEVGVAGAAARGEAGGRPSAVVLPSAVSPSPSIGSLDSPDYADRLAADALEGDLEIDVPPAEPKAKPMSAALAAAARAAAARAAANGSGSSGSSSDGDEKSASDVMSDIDAGWIDEGADMEFDASQYIVPQVEAAAAAADVAARTLQTSEADICFYLDRVVAQFLDEAPEMLAPNQEPLSLEGFLTLERALPEVSEAQHIYNKLLYDGANEALRNVYRARHRIKVPSWIGRRRAPRPLPPPAEMMAMVQQHMLSCSNMRATSEATLDKLLAADAADEDRMWAEVDEEVAEVKLEVAEMLWDDLLTETAELLAGMQARIAQRG